MLSSPDGEEASRHNSKAKGHNRVSSSSSTSSSSSPFSSSSNLQLHHQTQKPNSMEEVWKDINLASLHDHSSTYQDFPVANTPRLSLRNPQHSHNYILQDFLARPFGKEPPTRIVSSNRDPTLYSSPVPPPATALSLNSGPGFHFLDNSDPLRPSSRLQSNQISNVSSFDTPFEVLVSSSGGLLSFAKPRVQESDSSSGDRRHKRKIKNRESAARSRARKQAYTNELEQEVQHLTEENARLKRQQAELCLVAAAQLPKKHTLHRTSTAPF